MLWQKNKGWAAQLPGPCSEIIIKKTLLCVADATSDYLKGVKGRSMLDVHMTQAAVELAAMTGYAMDEHGCAAVVGMMLDDIADLNSAVNFLARTMARVAKAYPVIFLTLGLSRDGFICLTALRAICHVMLSKHSTVSLAEFKRLAMCKLTTW